MFKNPSVAKTKGHLANQSEYDNSLISPKKSDFSMKSEKFAPNNDNLPQK